MFSCPILVFEIDVVRSRLLTVTIDHEAFSKPLYAWLKAQKEMHDHVLSCRVFVVIRNGWYEVSFYVFS